MQRLAFCRVRCRKIHGSVSYYDVVAVPGVVDDGGVVVMRVVVTVVLLVVGSVVVYSGIKKID